MNKGKKEHDKEVETYIQNRLRECPEYVSGYYKYLKHSTKVNSVDSHKKYINYVIRFLNTVNKEVQKITYIDLIDYMDAISTKENGEEISGDYRVAIYSALKRFFEYLYNAEIITKNPMDKIERPEKTKEYEKEERRCFLELDEIHQCYEQIARSRTKWKLRNKAMLALFLDTGIRCTALLEINLEDIDITNNTIYTIEKENELVTYYFSDEVKTILTDWLNQREKEFKGYENNEALFISQKRQRLSQREAEYIIGRYAKIEGKNITPHKLRHTFATQMDRAGASVDEVSDLLNHKSPQTTRNIYIHKSADQIRKSSLRSSKFSVM